MDKPKKELPPNGRNAFVIEQFNKHNIEFTVKNENAGHFHCRRKSDDKLFQFWSGTGKIMGYDDLRGIHNLINLLTAQINATHN